MSTAPALLVLGVGTLRSGWSRARAVPMLYGMVLWSFIVEIIGSNLTTNQWLLDTSVLTHLGSGARVQPRLGRDTLDGGARTDHRPRGSGRIPAT